MEEPVRKIKLALSYTTPKGIMFKQGAVVPERNGDNFHSIASSFVDKNPELFIQCSQDGETKQEMHKAQKNGVTYQIWDSEGCRWCNEPTTLICEPHIYRRKPEVKYRLYTVEDLKQRILRGETMYFEEDGEIFHIGNISPNGVVFVNQNMETEFSDFEYLLKYIKWVDGSRCGVLVQE